MARSPQRYLAVVAMLAVAFGGGLLLFIGWLLVAGFEGHETTGDDWHFLAAAIGGLAATLAAVAGLTVGSRLLTLGAVVAQAGAAAWLVWAIVAADFGGGDDMGDILLGLLGLGVAELLALSAVAMPLQADEAPESRPERVPGAVSTSGRKVALAGMIGVGVVSLALLGKASTEGTFALLSSPGLTGIVGLAGAIPCIYALGAWRGSLAAGVAVTQAVLATMLFLLYGMHGSYGAAHALIVVADVVTLVVALGAGFRIPRSAAPRPRAQG